MKVENKDYFEILKSGVKAWNKWRNENSDLNINLSWSDLSKSDFSEVDFSGLNLRDANLNGSILKKAILRDTNLSGSDLCSCNLCEADLSMSNLEGAFLIHSDLKRAKLINANLSSTDLSRADLSEAILNNTNLTGSLISYADLKGADLRTAKLQGAFLVGSNLCKANLSRADLIAANLSNADLRGANLSSAYLDRTSFECANLRDALLTGASLLGTDFRKADLTNSRIFGISAWQLKLDKTIQRDLIISEFDEPTTVTVDNLEVAQFIYLLLNNNRIRDVIDTIGKKVVLILGRFKEERKTILDAIRDELRSHDYLPVLFDFKKPDSRTFIETVSTLAHLARFIIADITDPKIVLHEIPHILTNIAVPIKPLLQKSEKEAITFADLRIQYNYLLETHLYENIDDLLKALKSEIINPSETKAIELQKKKSLL